MDRFRTRAITSADGTAFLLAKSNDRTRVFVREGAAWTPIAAPDGVRAFAARGDAWFALAGDRLHESLDRGATWLAHALPPAPGRRPPEGIVIVSPRPESYVQLVAGDDRELYALANDRVVRVEEDGGPHVLAASPDADMLVSLAACDGELVVGDSRHRVFRLAGNRLERFDHGLPDSPTPEGLHMSAHLAIAGGRFIALSRGRFERGVADRSWMQTAAPRGVARGLCTAPEGWIEADDDGVRYLRRGEIAWNVDPGVLAGSVAWTGEDVIVGSVRATRDHAGAVISRDGRVTPVPLESA